MAIRSVAEGFEVEQRHELTAQDDTHVLLLLVPTLTIRLRLQAVSSYALVL